MKRLVLLITVLSLTSSLSAQVNIHGLPSPVKLSDVEAYYIKYVQPYLHAESEGNEHGKKKAHKGKESADRDYQFDRWKWYWKQHVDNNGYIISPMKTYREWLKYNAEHALEKTTGTSSGANWSFQGDDSSGASGSGVGRINNIAFHPTDTNTYWVGSPAGGAWKTTDNGHSWTCMTDKLPLISVTEILFNPLNPNTVYLCTGDGDGQDYSSIGVLKSYNGGLTWDTTGMTWGAYEYHFANSMLINPKDTNSLTLATDTGIYKSFDGGNTWEQVVGSGDYAQLVYHPADTNIMYTTSYEETAQGQIYRSANGGMTWTKVSAFTDAERITLAVSPANTGVVKAIVAASDNANFGGLTGIYSSSDTGKTFTEIYAAGTCSGKSKKNLLSFDMDGTQCGGQGWYDLTLAISPLNINNIYIGGVNGWLSTNGGTSWTIMDQWDTFYYYGSYSYGIADVATIHADKHFMGFNPLLPNRFFETNDGGVYWSDDASATSMWNDVTNGIGITEFYRAAISGTATYELGGAQDVGSKMLRNLSFSEDVDNGDGAECWIDYADTNVFYTSVDGGTIDYQNISTGAYTDIATNIAGGAVEGNGAWVTPFVIEPTCHTCILAGYQDVYRTTDQGTTWTDISGTLTSTDILRVETTLADSNTIYAAGDGSDSIYYTHNMGTTWSNIVAPYGTPTYPINISDLITDPTDANHIWVAFSSYTDYGSPQVASYSPTTGWVLFNTNLPDANVDCIQLDTKNRTLYAGTDVGVFYRDTTMTEWEPFTTGMPVVGVYDLQIDYTRNKIWAATFGRSLWSSAKHTVPTGISNVSSANKNITVIPNPNHGSFTVILDGSKTTADKVSLKLLDNNGKLVWQGNGTATANNNIEVNTQGLAAGVYILEIEDAAGIAGQKEIVIY